MNTKFLNKLVAVTTATKNLAIAGVCLALVLGGYLTYSAFVAHRLEPITEANASEYMGWLGEETVKAEWPVMAKSFPKFQIKGAPQDNAKRRVVLWDAAKAANRGEHLPTFRQLIGDCVGAGAKQAIQYLQCVQIALHGGRYHGIYSPYHYAVGRNAPECGRGRLGRDPSGSIGSWQADAIRLYGVLAEGFEGLQPYSKAVVSTWAVRMPEMRYLTEGKQHLVRTVSKIDTPEEMRDGICNGYPSTIASSAGFQMRPQVVGGKLVNRRTGTWQHQMCVIGYDGTGAEPLWYILNSWGPDAHGTPPDDSPPGGFWVRRADIVYIIKQGDTFAFSQFDGFEPQDLNIFSYAPKLQPSISQETQPCDRSRTLFALAL